MVWIVNEATSMNGEKCMDQNIVFQISDFGL